MQTKKDRENQAWRRCLNNQKDVENEERECRKRGEHTFHCRNLRRDAAVLKAEYEKVCRAPESNPLSVSHGEKFMSEKIIGDLMGRNGPDTHHRIDGDKNRRSK
jgi:hypothetical protein